MHIAGCGDGDGIVNASGDDGGVRVRNLRQPSSVRIATATGVTPTYEGKEDGRQQTKDWVDDWKINAVDWRVYIQNRDMSRHNGRVQFGRSVLLCLRTATS